MPLPLYCGFIYHLTLICITNITLDHFVLDTEVDHIISVLMLPTLSTIFEITNMIHLILLIFETINHHWIPVIYTRFYILWLEIQDDKLWK